MSNTISYPRDTIEQAELTAEGWEQVENHLSVPSLSLAHFKQKLERAKHHIEVAEDFKLKRSRAVEVRNHALKDLWDYTKRIRNAAKATFGDDSSEVEKMGVVPVRSRRRKIITE